MLDSMYHMTLTLFLNRVFWRENVEILPDR